MKKHKVHIKDGLADDCSLIIKEYWEIGDNDFINKPKQICEKHNITISELSKIIKDCSYCNIIHEYCSDCNKLIEDKAYSQTSFNEKKRGFIKKRCDDCEYEFYKTLKEKERNQIEVGFTQAIQEKRWNLLTNEEFEILKGIVRLKKKSLIYKDLFNGKPYDNSIWKKVKSIQKKGLIFVKYNSEGGVIEFVFSERLEQVLFREDKKTLNEDLDFLSFSLSKNSNKTQIRQPDYSGAFILKRPIRLDTNVKYVYGGWLNKDGSINLKIQSLNNIVQKVDYSNIDNEPIQIKDILNKLFNDFDANDLL